MHREIVFRIRKHIGVAIQEGRELKLKPVVLDYFIEDTFLSQIERLFLDNKGALVAQSQRVAILRVAPVLNRKPVYFPDKGLDYRFRRLELCEALHVIKQHRCSGVV